MNYVIKGFIEVYRRVLNDVDPILINTSRIIAITESGILLDNGTGDPSRVDYTESYDELTRKLFKAQ